MTKANTKEVKTIKAPPRRTQSSRQAAQGKGETPSRVAVDIGLRDAGGGNDTQFVSSVARALAVLNAFLPKGGRLGNTELAERTGLTKPTVSRLTYTLAQCGYLSFNPRYRVYELGPKASVLGHVALSSSDVRRVARPLMQELAQHSNFNVGLGTRDKHLMVYTDAFEGDGIIGLRLFAGSRLPILSSAMGRAYLVGLREEERDVLLNELRPRFGDEWSSLMKALEQSIQDFNAYGFCVSLGEWQKDINGAAAPIRSPGRGRVYAVNLGGPAYLLPEKLLRGELGERIAKLAHTVEASISIDG